MKKKKSVNQSLLLQHNLLFGGADAAPPYIFGSEMTCSSLYCAPHFLVLVRLFPEATSEICLLVRRLWFQHVLNSSITPLVCIDLHSFISSRCPSSDWEVSHLAIECNNCRLYFPQEMQFHQSVHVFMSWMFLISNRRNLKPTRLDCQNKIMLIPDIRVIAVLAEILYNFASHSKRQIIQCYGKIPF